MASGCKSRHRMAHAATSPASHPCTPWITLGQAPRHLAGAQGPFALPRYERVHTAVISIGTRVQSCAARLLWRQCVLPRGDSELAFFPVIAVVLSGYQRRNPRHPTSGAAKHADWRGRCPRRSVYMHVDLSTCTCESACNGRGASTL